MDTESKSLLIDQNAMGAKCFKRGAIVVYHDNNLIDIGIRVGSGSFYTHTGIALGNGSTICAFIGHGVWTGYGDDAQADLNGTAHVQARMPPSNIDPEKLIASATSVLGKPYDLAGFPADPLTNLFRFFTILRYPGGPPTRFHCSSLIAWALRLQDPTIPFGHKSFRAITPQDIANYIGA